MDATRSIAATLRPPLPVHERLAGKLRAAAHYAIACSSTGRVAGLVSRHRAPTMGRAAWDAATALDVRAPSLTVALFCARAARTIARGIGLRLPAVPRRKAELDAWAIAAYRAIDAWGTSRGIRAFEGQALAEPMAIVLAWYGAEPGRGAGARAAMWRQAGTRGDVAAAAEYAAPREYHVHVFDLAEPDPLGRARGEEERLHGADHPCGVAPLRDVPLLAELPDPPEVAAVLDAERRMAAATS